jgi:hypothetical protein
MKKVLAMVVSVMVMVGAGVAQKSKAVASPAINATSPVIGYIPVFFDTGGDVDDSVIFQSTTGQIGIGTASPAALLDVSSTNPTLRVDNYSNTVGDSPNFNFISARGTSTTPLATQAGDNLGQFAAAGFTGTLPFTGSKVKVTFLATDTWTPTDTGTGMNFQTTANGSTTRTSRMYIDQSGNIGIGSLFGPPANGGTAPQYPLTVTGEVESSGGFVFPDGTLQITKAVSGVTITSPDGSITVGGTVTAPTVAVNTADIQKRIALPCAAGSAVTAVNADGSVVCGSVAPGGTLASVPVVVASTTLTCTTNCSGLQTAQTLYTPTVTGFYRVSVYMNVPTVGTCVTAPCTGEAIAVQWNDGVSTTALATANCNLVTACGSSVVTPIWVVSGQAITAYGQSYGTGVAPGGTPAFTAHVLVEQM